MKISLPSAFDMIVRIDELVPNPCNPARRTDPVALRELRKLLDAEPDRAASIVYPVTREMVVLDGHRRLAVQKARGVTHVYIKFFNLPPEALTQFGPGARSYGGADCLASWSLGKSAKQRCLAPALGSDEQGGE